MDTAVGWSCQSATSHAVRSAVVRGGVEAWMYRGSTTTRCTTSPARPKNVESGGTMTCTGS